MKRLALILLSALALPSVARAQNSGFALERYEPTAAGQWSFMVDHPWYTRSRYFAAAGLTLDYSHDPLVFGRIDPNGGVTTTSRVVEDQLALHVDAAFSFLDRVSLTLSLPVVLFETGATIEGAGPLSGGAVGDPRVGAMVRLWGHPLRDAFSIHFGVDLWIPVGADDNHAGDSTVRVMPKLVLAGLSHHAFWSFVAGYQYRPEAKIGMMPAGQGNSVGSELKLGVALGYADVEKRFAVGPELMSSTGVTGPAAFDRSSTSLELLLGAHYNIAGQIDAGIAGGIGLFTAPGTPDGRVIFRLAYAPIRPEPVRRAPTPLPAPEPPPPSDRDHDGVDDAHDLCPDEPAGAHPDADRPGCPIKDTDGDGVLDTEDECPDTAAGPHPNAVHHGCPDTDKDGDGVFDSVDQCPDVASGLHPDPDKAGCPLADRDQDGVPDVNDACPDKPGAPSPDPKKNGCPGLVEIKNGQVVILKPVFFATNKDVILPQSFPVLQAVADALIAQPDIKRVSIEGHTDDRGKPERNLDLSDRRARSVMRFLVEHGVQAERLEAHGFGQEKPLQPNKTAKGRAANRRVEFRIVEGPPGAPLPSQ